MHIEVIIFWSIFQPTFLTCIWSFSTPEAVNSTFPFPADVVRCLLTNNTWSRKYCTAWTGRGIGIHYSSWSSRLWRWGRWRVLFRKTFSRKGWGCLRLLFLMTFGCCIHVTFVGESCIAPSVKPTQWGYDFRIKPTLWIMKKYIKALF